MNKPRYRYEDERWVEVATCPPPGIELYRQVRAAFVVKGESIKGWCRENGTHFSNARNSLVGSWDGPRGRAMRAKLVKASGLKLSA